MVYLSYLLRIWSEKDFDRISWRLSLEKPGSGEMAGFQTLEALMSFLEQKIRESQDELISDDGCQD